MDRILKVVPDFKAEKDEPWCVTLTLETATLMRQVDLGFARASQAHSKNPAVLDIPQTIQTLSGVEAVVLEGEELKDKPKLCMCLHRF